jgi:hypothetical protein
MISNYSYNARDINTQGMSLQMMQQQCPSMFAENAHESRSSRYLYIPTITLVERLSQAGFVVTQVMQSKSRKEGQQEFTKHLIRLRQASDLRVRQEEYREVVIINSHNGTSSYQIMQGIFRLICSNGLIVGDINRSLRVQHKASALDEVIEATYSIIEEGKETLEVVNEMKQIELSREKQLLLAEFAMAARFDVNPNDKDAMALIPYRPEQFLRRHRIQDMDKNDLNTVFNVVQENVIRPNKYISYHDSTRERKKHTLKDINGIDQNVKLNTMLFALAERMAKLS